MIDACPQKRVANVDRVLDRLCVRRSNANSPASEDAGLKTDSDFYCQTDVATLVTAASSLVEVTEAVAGNGLAICRGWIIRTVARIPLRKVISVSSLMASVNVAVTTAVTTSVDIAVAV